MGISCILNSGHFGEVPKLAEGTPLERVQVVNSGARVQIPPSPLNHFTNFVKSFNNFLTNLVRDGNMIWLTDKSVRKKMKKVVDMAAKM